MTPAVAAALLIDEIVSDLPEDERERALNMVWFTYVGRTMDWTGRYYRKPETLNRPRGGLED